MADDPTSPPTGPQSTPTFQTYIEEPPSPIPPAFSALLSNHSSIPPDSQATHIKTVRDKAFAQHPYPCLGRWRFLYLDLTSHPLYQTHVVPHLTSQPDTLHPPHDPLFVDVGTCLGQDLRQLMADGVPASHLHGADLHWHFIEASYELFGDEDRLPRGRFCVPANLLGATPDSLARLDGRCDVVNVTAVFHLFDLPEQRTVADRVVRLLRRDPGERKLLLGAQVGRVQAAGENRGLGGKRRYRHDMESWRALWDERLGREEVRDGLGVKGWEVGGKLLGRGEVQGGLPAGEMKTEESGRGWVTSEHRWQVWWVWVQF